MPSTANSTEIKARQPNTRRWKSTRLSSIDEKAGEADGAIEVDEDPESDGWSKVSLSTVSEDDAPHANRYVNALMSL